VLDKQKANIYVRNVAAKSYDDDDDNLIDISDVNLKQIFPLSCATHSPNRVKTMISLTEGMNGNHNR
jgi:hypothetical protein